MTQIVNLKPHDIPAAVEGIGSALIRSAPDKADQESKACYLDTAGEETLAFYERHGFGVARRGTVAETGVEKWTMRRTPRS